MRPPPLLRLAKQVSSPSTRHPRRCGSCFSHTMSLFLGRLRLRAMPSFLGLWLLLVSLCFLFGSALASHGHRGHAHLHAHVHNSRAASHSTEEITAEDAALLLAKAMPALRRANKYRVENPRLNTWKFPTAANSTTVPVSIIDTQSDRRAVRQNSSAVHDYFIPLELAAAAKKVASLTRHPSAANDKSTATAETLKSTYWRETNDTNTPEPSDAPGSGSAPVKRAAATKYWMESMLMNGAAPYAQQGYTVMPNPTRRILGESPANFALGVPQRQRLWC